MPVSIRILSIAIVILMSICCIQPKIRKVPFMSAERPVISYCNSKYLAYCNFTAQRYSRDNPMYYLAVHVQNTIGFGNNATFHIIFYEYLSNVYKRGFIDLNYKFCDLLKTAKYLGVVFESASLAMYPCPYPPGQYHVYNITMPVSQVPKNFPISKGRLYINITHTDTGEKLANVHVDIEMKMIKVRD